METFDAYMKLIEQQKAHIPSGASFTGDLSERARQLFSTVEGKMAGSIVSMHPGDYVRTGSDEEHGISLAAPIGYDVWYLFPAAQEDIAYDEEAMDALLEYLGPFTQKLQDIKPLKTLRSVDDLAYVSWWSWPQSMEYWANNAPYIFKEMRFETVLLGSDFLYNSKGNIPESVGFLAFPVGQLGVMEIVSLATESYCPSVAGSEDNVVEGGGMMPPVHHTRGACAGHHLVEEGYLQQPNAEILADEFGGLPSAEPHSWLRYWIQPSDKFPAPGEFVVLLAKSELYHVWWFQETYPFMYSGNFFETEYYTSGIVKEVHTFNDVGEPTVCKVLFNGVYETYLRSTDYYEYEVDDRVAILKVAQLLNAFSGGEITYNMDWTRLSAPGSHDGHSFASPEIGWRIAPISFYE